MAKTFTAQVEAFVVATDKRINALVRQSVQDVIEQAQTPVSKGGRMRVDTGFLRKSGQMSYNGMPTGPTRGDKTAKHSYDDGSEPVDATVIVQLAEYQPGATIFFGWCANYAKYREAFDGFLEGAVQNWQAIVTKNANAIKARIKA